jgi:hypothetical protein
MILRVNIISLKSSINQSIFIMVWYILFEALTEF